MKRVLFGFCIFQFSFPASANSCPGLLGDANAAIHEMLPIHKAVVDADDVTIFGLLRDKKDAFEACTHDNAFEPNSPEYTGVEVLRFAVRSCNTKLASFAISQAAQVTAEHLIDALDKPCVTALDVLVPKASPDAIADATKVAIGQATEESSSIADRAAFTVGFTRIAKTAMANCGTYGGRSCEAKDALKKMASDAVDADAAAKYAKTPAGLLAQACEMNDQLRHAQTAIDHEKEVGKQSGFVNATLMHSAGEAVVGYKNEIAQLKAAYQKGAGKPMSLSGCQN